MDSPTVRQVSAMKKPGTKELAYFRSPGGAELADLGTLGPQYLGMIGSGNYIGLQQPGKTEVIREVRDPWRRHLVCGLLALALTAILLAIATALYSSIDEGEAGARLRYRTEEEPGGREKREVGERGRRAAAEAGRAEAEERLMALMREPGCREDCLLLERRLEALAQSVDTLLSDLVAFRREIDRVARGCGNHTEEDSTELELSLPHLHPRTGDELEELTGRAANDKVVDHDLAGSAMEEVRFPLPGGAPGYPWPPALQGNERRDGIPPTGPDSAGLVVGGEPTGSGPGEAVHTSQQMSVSLPQRVQRVCSMVPGPPGSAGYLCSPVRDLMTDSQPPRDNFYLQVIGRSSQTHVPTAISTPNPYAFPTLSGSPVIVPASAAAPDQLIPIYNPTDGRILLQNYHQSTPVFHQSQDQLPVVPSQQGAANPPAPQQQGYSSAIPFQQFILAQYVPQAGFTPARPVYSPVQQTLHPPQLVYNPAYQASFQPVFTQPTFAQPQSFYGPAPAQAQFSPAQQTFNPAQPFAAVQPQLNSFSQVTYQQPALPPQVFIPQPAIQQSADKPSNQQCAYVIMPNSPVQTYQFPPVVGVSETIQRSGDPKQQLEGKQEKIEEDKNIKSPSDGKSKHKMDGMKMTHETKLNNTKMNYGFGAARCLPGSRACEDGSACIEKEDWCDGTVDCEDASDEMLCTCRERIFPNEFCDGYFDCPHGEDELGCSGCQEDMFSCFDVNDADTPGTCLPLEKRCDFVKDCRNGNDEKDCNLISDLPAEEVQVSVVSYSDGFLFRNWKGKWYPVCSANSWHLQACSAEIGELTGPAVLKLFEQPNYKGLMAKETNHGVEMVEECGQTGGAVLQVVCPEPMCGARPAARGDRVKRQLPWSDLYQPTMTQRPEDDHRVKSSPELKEDWMKQFFDTISVLDRKRFYKRLWGPLVEPYMGLKPDQSQDPPEHQAPLSHDPSESSWRAYLKPYQRTYESFDPGNFFPSYQDVIQYGQMQPYDFIPMEYYNYGNYPSEYINNYMEYPYYSEDYVRHLREIAEEEAARGLRVVGGTRSEPGAWPWIVSIYRDGDFLCGGTILTSSHILTAAHCVDRYEDRYYEVRAGLLRRKSFSPQEQIRTVDQIISHKNYNSKTMENDIALMRLSQRLKYNRWVLPACLPPERSDVPLPGTYCTAIGWGALHERGPDPDHLHEVQIPILPSCKHLVDRRGGEICAGYLEGGMDTCQGDSGGPLLCRSGSEKWYVAGVVSHGEGCARLGEPGAYTRVYLFKNWIQEHLSWPPESAKVSSTFCPGPSCKSGLCLPEKARCNSKFECFDGEDEKDCESSDPLPGQRSAINATSPTVPNKVNSAPEEAEPSVHLSTSVQEGWMNFSSEGIGQEAVTASTSDQVTASTEKGAGEEESLLLHSQQTQTVDTSKLFSCKRFEQRVLSSRLCDEKVDCEDGSDESACTCADRLKHLAPQLLCDGVTHCKDASDEFECTARCPKDEFFCFKSGNCVPKRSHCNMKKDCYFGEDEDDCYALVEDVSQLDNMKMQPFRLNGTVAVFNRSWQPYCLNSTPQATALDICQHLGFRIASDHKVLNADMPGSYKTCNHLYVSCSSSDDPVWMAPLFNSGSPQTLSVLITKNWLLAPTAGLQFKDWKVSLTAWLGKRNLSLAVEGPEDQYLRVDGLHTLSDGHLTLLHLHQPASITKRVMPLPFPDWQTPVNENEKCEVLSMTKEGAVTSLALKPVTCLKGIRCYKMNYTSDPAICSITGIVMCHSDYGPYLSSVVAGEMCKSSLIQLYDLTLERKAIIDHIESGSMEELEESACDGVRCESGGCLGWEKVGDGVANCYDARDESSEALAEKEHHCTLNSEHCTCPPGELRCPGGGCLSSAKFCDGHRDCANGEDESPCDCRSYLALTRPQQLCDGIQNCLDKEDESWEFCFNRSSDCSNRFQCPDSGGCIPTSFVCDGDADCPKGEDEEMCIAMRSPIDKPKEGVLFSRLYGELVSQCLEPEPGDELAEKVCWLRGDTGVASSHYSLVPYQYVLVDTFTKLRLNHNFSLTLRSDRQFATVQTSMDQTCSILYVQCK